MDARFALLILLAACWRASNADQSIAKLGVPVHPTKVLMITQGGVHWKAPALLKGNIQNRLRQFWTIHNQSDIRDWPLEVFHAVDGKQLDLKDYVSSAALRQILEMESTGFRTRHRDLTRGAVGCYLSHIGVYRRLLADPDQDFYVVLEDDATFNRTVGNGIRHVMSRQPKDWDVILFGRIRCQCSAVDSVFERAKYFWGLFGYAISRRGAEKMIARYDRIGIDMQIDSVMSQMSIAGALSVYAVSKDIVWQDYSFGTTMQKPLQETKGIDPFEV